MRQGAKNLTVVLAAAFPNTPRDGNFVAYEHNGEIGLAEQLKYIDEHM